MTRKFTFLMTAMALILAIMGPRSVAWGQTTSTTTYTFNSKSWEAIIGETAANWTSIKDGNQFTANQGIQVTKNTSGACGNSNVSYSNVSKITVTYCTNKKDGEGTISWYNVESTTAAAQSGNLVGSQSISAPSSGGTTLRTFDIIPESLQSGYIQLYVGCSTNSIYVWSVEIQYTSSPSTDPVINADDLELAYDATSGVIPYTITNPVEGQNLTARLPDGITWISDLTVGAGSVTFTTEANNSYDSRSAGITLSYEGAEDVTVTVIQDGKPAPIITVNPSPLFIPAAGEDEGTLSVSCTNFTPLYGLVYVYLDPECTITPEEDEWFLASFETGSTTTIEYFAYANTSSESRNVYMKVAMYDLELNELSVVVPVSQAGFVQTYTATTSINGIATSTPDITEFTLPSEITVPTGFDFAGWTTAENDVDPTHFVSGTVQLNDNMTFYAVFSRAEGGTVPVAYTAGDEGNFVIATKIGDTYLAIPQNPTVISGKITGVAIQTESSNNVTYVSATNATGYTWTIANATYGQTLSDGSKYLYHSKGGNAGTDLAYGDLTSYTWKIISETNGLSFQGMNGKNVKDRGLLYQKGTVNVFGGYALSNEDKDDYSRIVVLPISTNSGTTHYYTRVFNNETATDDILLSGPSIILANSTLNMGEHSLTVFLGSLLIEDGGQLIHSNDNVWVTMQKNITGYTDAEGNDGYYLIANPTSQADLVSHLTDNEYDLYTFNPETDGNGHEWINQHSDDPLDDLLIERETGYLYASSEDVTLKFAGTVLAAGSKDLNLTYASEGEGIDFPGFNLLGNPFACNAFVSRSFYVIDGSELVLSENNYVAPCEGFFVEATEAGQSVTLTTETPVAAPSALSLTVSQNRGNTIDRAIVSFDGNSNLHKFMLNPAHTNIRLAKNGEEFAALSSDAEGEIPVNFKAEKNGSYTITVNTENIDAQYLHLIDNKTGMDTDLLSSSSYTFEAKTSDYASRFKLVFGVNNTASENSDGNFAFMSDGNLVIDNIEGEATLQIADELGRIISTETVSGSYNKALNLKAGLYILNLNGMTQKIVVK